MDLSTTLYEERIEKIRKTEYPTLADTIYLDHAGTTPYARSLIERVSSDLVSNLYGNPHSASPSSQLSTRRIEDIRLNALRLFNADPEHFDLVFVANATAGIKVVMDAFRDSPEGFWYGYHKDSHTSLVGVREASTEGKRCFATDQEVEEWIESGSLQDTTSTEQPLQLFAYPAQSNMNGLRLPLRWCRRVRAAASRTGATRYSLLDAAALVSTSRLDLSDPLSAPDFTILSFYKIFGFPDLGALLVRKEAANILRRRHYFGGGSVEMVVCLKEQWHQKKSESIHEALEDGTLPIHSIVALRHAMDVHQELFGSMEEISRHTAQLARKLYTGLLSLRHGNCSSLCEIYKNASSTYGNTTGQGPIVAFNMRNAAGAWVSNTEVEKLASVRGIQLRTGGLCNPGGIATSLGLAPWEMRENFSAGQRCGNDSDVMGGKPTGVIRASLGAMSTTTDVNAFLDFLREFFIEDSVSSDVPMQEEGIQGISDGDFYVESVTIYPIKSCAGWGVPSGQDWEVRKEGLAWDREWCLIHQGTGVALNQKQHPKMALIRPSIDFLNGVLRIRHEGFSKTSQMPLREIIVPLSGDPKCFEPQIRDTLKAQTSTVCGDRIIAKAYTSPEISEFFTSILGVPCQLARFPSSGSAPSTRHAKAHLTDPFSHRRSRLLNTSLSRPILLSNESPILTISRASLNRLNEQIKACGGKAAHPSAFRANIVVAQNLCAIPGTEQPYAEDDWAFLKIGGRGAALYQILGRCRRCQMVCVDQRTAEKNEEPFVTLAKTRRTEGRIWFGMHACLMERQLRPRVRVGDRVTAYVHGENVVEAT